MNCRLSLLAVVLLSFTVSSLGHPTCTAGGLGSISKSDIDAVIAQYSGSADTIPVRQGAFMHFTSQGTAVFCVVNLNSFDADVSIASIVQAARGIEGSCCKPTDSCLNGEVNISNDGNWKLDIVYNVMDSCV
ncbi:unnamed protein product [Calypogeia fissa]